MLLVLLAMKLCSAGKKSSFASTEKNKRAKRQRRYAMSFSEQQTGSME
jgi:hypothetical protein